jgi:hypothetical protein
MPIKWDPLAVEEVLAEVEKDLALAEPHLRAAVDRLQTVRDIPNLPQYMTQPLAFAKDRVEGSLRSIHDYISRIRRDYPEGALRASRKGRQTALLQEQD